MIKTLTLYLVCEHFCLRRKAKADFRGGVYLMMKTTSPMIPH